MRIDRLFNGLALGILLGTGMAQAAELPQRWVSAGGSLSEWVVGGGYLFCHGGIRGAAGREAWSCAGSGILVRPDNKCARLVRSGQILKQNAQFLSQEWAGRDTE
ncbi:hypothetical protein Q009_04336 [Pseudomonas aeruginosa U2504]|nr:hypothetical protein Q009_04336 [Pseudomonas aeruginosa U2504]